MLVEKIENLFAAYQAINFPQKNQEYLQKLRTALPFIKPENYRGISREPLQPWSKDDESYLRKGKTMPDDFCRNEAARRRFLDFNEEDRSEWDSYVEGDDYNQALIQDLAIAEQLQTVVDSPGNFEIIEVAREAFLTQYKFLGFDIGYWTGDYFSLICDSIVMPQWHPTAPESFEELEKLIRCLNEYILFPSTEDADKFLKYYRSQSWAEEEYPIGEFCIIQVAAVSKTS